MKRAMFILLAGCGAASSTTTPTVANSSSGALSAGAAMRVTPPEIGGALGFAPLPVTDQSSSWLPRDGAAVLLDGAAPTGPLLVIAGDAALAATVHGPESVKYGCENNHLDMTALDVAPRPAPGLVWVMPAPLPVGWAPHAIAVTAGARSRRSRAWQVGAFAITSTARDDQHATFAIAAAGRVVYTVEVEQERMDGDGAGPIDLTTDDLGLPVPIAAFELARGGPVLVALYTQSHEGFAISTVLVDDHGGGATPLATDLYSCAY